MANQHPATPTAQEINKLFMLPLGEEERVIAAFCAGADQQLEECCEQLKSIPSPLGIPFGEIASNALRNACRPEPPSLKEQALHDLEALEKDLKRNGMGFGAATIRRALEQL
jgi:hypothetical protein